MKTDKLELAAARVVLGLVQPEDLVEAAVGSLEDGCDSPALRILAGLTVADGGDARALFDRALAELSVPSPSRRDAVIQVSRQTAEKIVNGATSPYEGAMEIWELTLKVPGEDVSELDSFVYAASEWEGRPDERRAFEDGIIAAALELVSPQHVDPP